MTNKEATEILEYMQIITSVDCSFCIYEEKCRSALDRLCDEAVNLAKKVLEKEN